MTIEMKKVTGSLAYLFDRGNMKNYIKALRENPYVKEKELGNNISSFNFTRKAFKKNIWDDQTIRARGLFIDIENQEIIARSFDKFFAGDEQGSKTFKGFTYPAYAYEKYNGFLGICSGGKDGKELFLASKSTDKGEFRDRFAEILDTYLSKSMQSAVANYLYRNDCTAVFEVIDPIEDPHIVEYDNRQLRLLALVDNTIDFHQASHYTLKWFAELIGVPYKKRLAVIYDDKELKRFLKDEKKKKYVEGAVLEDAAGNMMKVKTTWYKSWKKVRGQMEYYKAHGDKKEELDNLDLKVFIDEHPDGNVIEYRKYLTKKFLDKIQEP